MTAICVAGSARSAGRCTSKPCPVDPIPPDFAAKPLPEDRSYVADAIKDVTHHGEIVLDVFLGSGTTLIAAEQCHRRCYGVELDPRYVDVALQRWIALTGDQPIHAATGITFDQLRDQRLCALAE